MNVWLPAVRAGSGADVFTLRLAELLKGGGIRATVTWLPHWTEFAPELLRVAAPPGTHILHANSWNAFAFGEDALPRVVTVHHCVHDATFAQRKTFAQWVYHRLRIRPLERRSLECATAVTAVSEFTRNSVARVFGERQIEAIPNWVDTDRFRPAPPSRAVGPFRLLCTGNWGRRKGTDLLAPLMRRLGARFELSFTTGRRGVAPRHALPENMRWAGPVPDEAGMVRLYQACDAVVVSSRLEGFGYAALEAMACGKPVVAFNVASLPEVVADGVTGRLVTLDDVEALADACRELADDAALARRWGEAGRQRAIDSFSPARALSRYMSLYERVISELGHADRY